ncbi:MAG: STAS domain-containing protein [Planctomycetes bacterium]|nr:STAS domain-containing protein [Planctomycetota bacterium]
MRHRLTINHTEVEGIITIALCGRLDIESVPEAREYLEKLIEEKPGSGIILDLAELEYISSFGLSLLIGVLKETRRAGGELVLARVRQFVDQVIDIANLKPILKSYDSLAEAGQALKSKDGS